MEITFRFSDDQVQSQTSSKCDLLVEAGSHVLRLAVVDQGRDLLRFAIEVKHEEGATQDTLSELFAKEPILNFQFRKVKISESSAAFVLIPTELFNAELISDYTKFFPAATYTEVQAEEIKPAKAMAVYGLTNSLAIAFSKQFTSPLSFHCSNPLITAALKHPYHKQFIQLHVEEDRLSVVQVEDHRLLFYNQFQFSTSEELSYFLLQIINKLSLDHQTIKTILSGNSQQDSVIRRYFPLAEPASVSNFGIDTNLLPLGASPAFYTVLALQLCG